MSVKPRRLALLGLVFAFAGIGVWRGPALWRMATTKVVYELESGGLVVESRVHRWRTNDYGFPYVVSSSIWVSSGWLLTRRDNLNRRVTTWSEGSIYSQREGVLLGPPSVLRFEPPWRWGETDQTEPTAPWVLAGETQTAWWDSIPSDSKSEYELVEPYSE